MGAASRQEGLSFVADGVTEALIDRLASVRELDVVSRNGVAPYRGAGIAYDSIARALGAGTLVDGTVQDVGGRIQVSVQMIDGLSGAAFERTSVRLPTVEVIALQDSVAEEVSRFLRVRLGEEVRLRESRAGTNSTEAWFLLQRARGELNTASRLVAEGDAMVAWEAYGRADELAVGAAVLDEDWVEPALIRAEAAYRRSRLLAGEPAEASEFAGQAVSRADEALELSPGSARALELRGTANYWVWLLGIEEDPGAREAQLENARADLEDAVAADPTLASAHSTLSHLYYQVDDVPAAVLAARAAYEEDAYLEVADVVLRRLYNGSFDLTQFREARRWCEEGYRRFPDDWNFTSCRLWLMIPEGTEPDPDRAWALRDTLLELTPPEGREFNALLSRLIVGGVLRRAQLADSAEVVLISGRGDFRVDPEQELMGYEAAIRSVTGDTEGAIDLLKRYVSANAEHRFDVGGNLHWFWQPLSDHPEFRTILGRD
jgi:serine/threonine-protein kinase